MFSFFKNNKRKNEIKKIIEWVNSLEEKYKKVESLKQKLYYKNIIIENMIEVSGGHIWRKDKDFNYIYCDNGWKESFFDLDSSFEILGKTDKELLDNFRSDGRIHTFGDICKGTDVDCIERNKKCHYIELGYICKKLFILDVIKTPTEDDGTVGFAKDVSNEFERVLKEVEYLLKKGNAEIVFKKENDVVAYYIKSQNIFNTVNTENIIFPE